MSDYGDLCRDLRSAKREHRHPRKEEEMTDRELLELAAKAAGIKHMGWVPAGLTFAHCGPWNPLADSGQALELAVKRKILRCHMDLFHRFYEEEIARGRSEADATRRAIVRAAAEIGRNMK